MATEKKRSRVKEPSSMAGVGTIIAAAAPYLPPPWNVVAGAGSAVFGALAVLMREKGAAG